MAGHIVKCPKCEQKFDADIEPYVVVNRRYYHTKCLGDNITESIQLIKNKTNRHNVKCKYCGKTFNTNAEDFVKFEEERRYAHKECAEHPEKFMTEEQMDKMKLDEYIMKLFKTDYVFPLNQRLIKKYMEEYKCSYKDIHKALKYHYEVQHGNVERAGGNITIVPYVLENARKYYQSIWYAQQVNNAESVRTITENAKPPKEIITTSPIERASRKKKKMFTFLEEEE